MLDFLYAFGIGIAFSLGICVGAFLAQMATKAGRKELDEKFMSHTSIVEKRLASYVEHTSRIADTLDSINSKVGAR